MLPGIIELDLHNLNCGQAKIKIDSLLRRAGIRLRPSRKSTPDPPRRQPGDHGINIAGTVRKSQTGARTARLAKGDLFHG